MTNIDWKNSKAAVFRATSKQLKAISEIESTSLDDLLGIETQKEEIIYNTEAFVKGQPANHVLLWGSRGTGKSSLIKAILNTYSPKGLRMIEMAKDDLEYLPEIADSLRNEPYYFVIFCDDLTFESDESSYKHLKTILEGSLESRPTNILIYATSNRRHLMPEFQKDNDATVVGDGELHYGDSVEEKISLSDRFGLWLSFYSGTQKAFLTLVDHYFKDDAFDKEHLHEEAKRYAAFRASRSGRTAKQFYIYYKAKYS